MIILLQVALCLAIGLLMSRVVKPLSLPAVTGYLIGGILIGPYVLGQFGIDGLGFTSPAQVSALSLISDVALGFIAFSIGNEFRLKDLKKIGKQALVIGTLQALIAAAFVDVALIGLHFLLGDKLPISTAITLGAIATATAPAATLMVVRQYKAKGELTDLLLPIVALDDAVGLIVFAVSFGIARALENGTVDLISILVNPILEIVCSLLLGSVTGLLLTQCERFFHSRSKRLSLVVTSVVLTVALSKMVISAGPLTISFSPLLVCMMMATLFCNTCDLSEELMDRLDRWTAPIFILFFVISGAELELNVFSDWSVVLIGIVYIVFRSAGKYFGARFSCKLMRCSENIVRYLGITLLPQAGVALGMAVTVTNLMGEEGHVIRSIVLFGVLIYELFGPLMTKTALTKAGDIQPGATDARTEKKN